MLKKHRWNILIVCFSLLLLVYSQIYLPYSEKKILEERGINNYAAVLSFENTRRGMYLGYYAGPDYYKKYLKSEEYFEIGDIVNIKYDPSEPDVMQMTAGAFKISDDTLVRGAMLDAKAGGSYMRYSYRYNNILFHKVEKRNYECCAFDSVDIIVSKSNPSISYLKK
jgi:hypothetical protein